MRKKTIAQPLNIETGLVPSSEVPSSESRVAEHIVAKTTVSFSRVVVVSFLFLVAFVGSYVYISSHQRSSVPTGAASQVRVIKEEIRLPETKSISNVDARRLSVGAVLMPLNPTNNEQVIIPDALLTVKGSFEAAQPAARAWANDAELVFIKSLSALTGEGRSSAWQLIFGSKTMRKNFEILIMKDRVVQTKELSSAMLGAALPEHWFDSTGAVASLKTMPQFFGASVAGLTFFYNGDAKVWQYGLSTSVGNTAMYVQ